MPPGRNDWTTWVCERTAVTVRGEEDNPISPDAADPSRGRGQQQTGRSIAARRPAARILVGPYHSALGYFTGQGPTEDEWKWGVESMHEVAEYAGQWA